MSESQELQTGTAPDAQDEDPQSAGASLRVAPGSAPPASVHSASSDDLAGEGLSQSSEGPSITPQTAPSKARWPLIALGLIVVSAAIAFSVWYWWPSPTVVFGIQDPVVHPSEMYRGVGLVDLNGRHRVTFVEGWGHVYRVKSLPFHMRDNFVSPDHRWVALYRRFGDNFADFELQLYDRKGKELLSTTAAGVCGGTNAFCGYSPSGDLFTYLDSTAQRTVGVGRKGNLQVAIPGAYVVGYYPDGRSAVALLHDPTGDVSTLVRVDLGTGELQHLVELQARAVTQSMIITPDESHLVYAGPGYLGAVDLETAEDRRLFPGLHKDEAIYVVAYDSVLVSWVQGILAVVDYGQMEAKNISWDVPERLGQGNSLPFALSEDEHILLYVERVQDWHSIIQTNIAGGDNTGGTLIGRTDMAVQQVALAADGSVIAHVGYLLQRYDPEFQEWNTLSTNVSSFKMSPEGDLIIFAVAVLPARFSDPATDIYWTSSGYQLTPGSMQFVSADIKSMRLDGSEEKLIAQVEGGFVTILDVHSRTWLDWLPFSRG